MDKQIEEMITVVYPWLREVPIEERKKLIKNVSWLPAVEILYKAGYRKADDLLKELQSMKSDFAKDMLEIKETYEKEVVDLVNEVRKETALKFAERLKYTLIINNEENTEIFDYNLTLETINEIAKEFIGGM